MTNELTDDELREAIVRHEWDQFQRTNRIWWNTGQLPWHAARPPSLLVRWN